MKKPADLIRFISNIPVLNDGTVPKNTLTETDEFISSLYVPVYALSTLSRITQDTLKAGKIEEDSVELGERTIVKQVLNSDLATFDPNVYTLVRMVVLESFSLLYHIETESSNLKYVSPRDIQRARNNVNYIADFMGTHSKYYHMIKTLRDIHISFGYLENQVDVIMRNRSREVR